MVFEKVQAIIAEQINIDAAQIQLDSSVVDLKIDSLDMVEIIMRLEEDFDITVDENIQVNTVKDLVDYIENETK